MPLREARTLALLIALFGLAANGVAQAQLPAPQAPLSEPAAATGTPETEAPAPAFDATPATQPVPPVEPAPLAPPELGAAQAAESEPGIPIVDTLNESPMPIAQDTSDASNEGRKPLRYLLERIEVSGAHRTSKGLIRTFVPIERGETFDVADPEIEALRYRLLGTGWFDRVDLRLARGRKPGWVVLIIEVEERQTLVFQQLAVGVGWSVEGVNKRKGDDESRQGRKPEPYLGLGVAETNFLGTGRTIGGEVLAAPDQQGLALRFFDPVVRASRWSLRADILLTKGREYFGGDNEVLVSVACSDVVDPENRADCEVEPRVAVVDYYRLGLGFGTARDLGSFTRLSVGLHTDLVNVPPGKMPVAASEVRALGESDRRRTPIDFAIEPDKSVVSMLTIGLGYDKRDSSVLPSRGTLLTFRGDLSSRLGISDYEFVRLQSTANRWFRLPWRHVVRVGGFAGAIFGNAPFFYKFFVSDLTDLQPARILDLNLDHRPAPNLFGVLQCGRPFDPKCGTAIEQMRQEELAARVDVEYTWPFVRKRRGFLKGGDLFGLFGLYALADPDDLRVALPGYKGFGRAPLDLTFDIGVRLDTQAGVFRLGFAKLFWLPVLGPEQ
jgi:hypothetical protein